MAWTATILDVQPTLTETTIEILVRYSDGVRSHEIRLTLPDTYTAAQARAEIQRVFDELKAHYLRVNTAKAFIGTSFTVG